MQIKECDFLDFYNSRRFNANCFNDDGTINKRYNSQKVTGTIAQIFEDHWNDYYEANKDVILAHRPNADKEIHKIIDCYNKDLGCSVYECPNCNDIVFIGHTCKSRLCSSCGYKYKNQRVNSILQTAYNCKHRQIVFTIPQQLRKYFFSPFEDRIDILFKAVRNTIYSILNCSFKKCKNGKLKKYFSKIKYMPGFFSFLHTFGRDLKWNPHIHVLIAELKIGNDTICKNWNYFDFDALSLRFQKILLDLLSKELGKSFNETKTFLFKTYKKGFYVYAEAKKFKDLKSGIEYIARYCGRVPISENRIVNYDGNNVTFEYIDHKDNSKHSLTVSAFEFIAMLVRHLIPNNFKIIRYYGFYRRKVAIHEKMIHIIKTHVRKFKDELTKFRNSICINFNRDPYDCPKCGTRLLYSVFLN